MAEASSSSTSSASAPPSSSTSASPASTSASRRRKTRAERFDDAARPTERLVDMNDPRVSLRPLPDSLKEYRAREGPLRRSRLRRVFDDAEGEGAEFPAFLRRCDFRERELWHVFLELDEDRDGFLSRAEVRDAAKSAGVSDMATVDAFVRDLDRNKDGYVSFDELRDFALLAPRPYTMRDLLRYYQLKRPSMSHLTQDGDVSIGRGKTSFAATASAAATAAQQRVKRVIVDEEDDDDCEEEDEAPIGMLTGAGKFLLAGGIAGAVSRTATAPFDRLKVFLITSGKRPGSASARGRLGAAVRHLYKQGGVRVFWTGNGLSVLKIFPESAIKFLTYESSKRLLAQYWDHVPDQSMISQSSRFLAGGLGGVVSQTFIYPIETLKTRVMSSSGGATKGNALIAETIQHMWRLGGARIFFRGLPAGLVGVFPYAALDMSTYELLKLTYSKWVDEEPGVAASLTMGALSGGLGATSVYPLNLVRTRLQAQGTPAHPARYDGIVDAARQCYRNEGWRGFYKGLTPTLVKVVPAVAISYTVYDRTKRMLFAEQQTHQDDDDCNE